MLSCWEAHSVYEPLKPTSVLFGGQSLAHFNLQKFLVSRGNWMCNKTELFEHYIHTVMRTQQMQMLFRVYTPLLSS